LLAAGTPPPAYSPGVEDSHQSGQSPSPDANAMDTTNINEVSPVAYQASSFIAHGKQLF
jgi:hypothetical protein